MFLAAAYALQGNDRRAQSEKVKLLAQWPEASIAQFKASRNCDVPAYLQQTEAHLYAGLRKAGIPEQKTSGPRGSRERLLFASPGAGVTAECQATAGRISQVGVSDRPGAGTGLVDWGRWHGRAGRSLQWRVDYGRIGGLGGDPSC
jgi:hypothetical protein